MFVFIIRSVYIVYTVLGDVSIYVVGKDEYDELACKFMSHSFGFWFKFMLLQAVSLLNIIIYQSW